MCVCVCVHVCVCVCVCVCPIHKDAGDFTHLKPQQLIGRNIFAEQRLICCSIAPPAGDTTEPNEWLGSDKMIVHIPHLNPLT